MALNVNKKNYRLADMSISPDTEVPYPDPDESAVIYNDSSDMAEFGTALYVRERRGDDGLIEQFALMLNVTPALDFFNRCKSLKGNQKNFDQVRRTDTWHGTVHSHQFYIDSDQCDRDVHENLAGGDFESKSRRRVNGVVYNEHYNRMLHDPSEYLDRWKAGKR